MNKSFRGCLCHTITLLHPYITYLAAYRRTKIVVHQILMYVFESTMLHNIFKRQKNWTVMLHLNVITLCQPHVCYCNFIEYKLFLIFWFSWFSLPYAILHGIDSITTLLLLYMCYQWIINELRAKASWQMTTPQPQKLARNRWCNLNLDLVHCFIFTLCAWSNDHTLSG